MYKLTRSLIRSPALRQGVQMMQTQQLKMKVVPFKDTCTTVSYDEKNMAMHREMSPFMTIYKPQLTSMLSITHRLTGMALAGYAWTLGFAALILPQDISHYVAIIEGLELGSFTLIAIKFILAYPFSYHAINGIRHLFWDLGHFLRIKEVYATGYAMILFSLVLNTGLAML